MLDESDEDGVNVFEQDNDDTVEEAVPAAEYVCERDAFKVTVGVRLSQGTM